MGDFQLQTSQRDQTPANRRPKTAPDLNRNQRKVAKKSLNSAFAVSPEDISAASDSLKELLEASDDNLFPKSAENFPASVHASETHSSEKVSVSDLTSTPTSTLSSLTATPSKHTASDMANTKRHEVDSFKMATSVEAELIIKYLTEARIQVLKSKDLSSSKKILEALVDVTIEEFGGLYEDGHWLDKLLSSKCKVVFLICIMVIFALLMVWLFEWSSKESFISLTPT